MKIQTKTVLKDLSGKEVIFDSKPFTVGYAIGQIITLGKSTNPLKSYLLATKLSEQDEVEIDLTDKKLIEDMIKDPACSFFPIITGQILKILEEAK